jgi:two-component system, OmpR family, phosphate regulon response regulator PhoB
MTTVVVAEDDALIREMLEYLLTSAGFNVHAYRDGLSALEGVLRDRPDLVLLDVVMPGISGLDVCRALRSDQVSGSVPVILLTARGQWLDVSAGFDAGADDYVVKPFAVNELLARINALLSHERPGQLGRT